MPEELLRHCGPRGSTVFAALRTTADPTKRVGYLNRVIGDLEALGRRGSDDSSDDDGQGVA